MGEYNGRNFENQSEQNVIADLTPTPVLTFQKWYAVRGAPNQRILMKAEAIAEDCINPRGGPEAGKKC